MRVFIEDGKNTYGFTFKATVSAKELYNKLGEFLIQYKKAEKKSKGTKGWISMVENNE